MRKKLSQFHKFLLQCFRLDEEENLEFIVIEYKVLRLILPSAAQRYFQLCLFGMGSWRFHLLI